MTTASHDFEYYERTIHSMYRHYFMKRIALTSFALVIFLIYSYLFNEHLIINTIVIILLVIIDALLIRSMQKFSEVYQAFRTENEPSLKIGQVEETEYTYDVSFDAGATGTKADLRINKHAARNLPSTEKQYTLLAGMDKNMFTLQPLQLVYYDLLELTYEEKFRLKRNGYNRVPRFLRRFTWSNLKASAGNGLSFIAGNLFFLFILYRILRYLWYFVQMFFM